MVKRAVVIVVDVFLVAMMAGVGAARADEFSLNGADAPHHVRGILATQSAPETPTASAVGTPYPKPEAGYKRFDVVVSQAKIEEFDVIVIRIGIMSKNCNAFAVQGQLEKHVIEGWGSTYETFRSDGSILTTRMQCQDLSEPRFINGSGALYDTPRGYGRYANGDGYLRVFYIPNDFVVQVDYLKKTN